MDFHLPVLGQRVVASLLPAPAGPIVDGTLGGGGHSALLLDALGAEHRVVGIDRDPEALSFATDRISDERFVALKGTFGEMKRVLKQAGEDTDQALSGILVDLGVSSYQLDTARRGFAFKHPDAPLDMRMDPTVDSSARDRIEQADVETLAGWLRTYGEVRGAKRVAHAIKQASDAGELKTTGDLARVVEAVSRPQHGRGRRVHPATTVFQALRIVVNDELAQLDQLLESAPSLLKTGGRLAVISYHSLEDRRVKRAFREGARPPSRGKLPPPPDWAPVWREVTRRGVIADDLEVSHNPRARSARLRVGERVRASVGGCS